MGSARVCLRKGEPSLVKLCPRGLVVATATTVKLDPDAGHTYTLKRNGPHRISAMGYRHVNLAIGVTFFQPETICGEDGSPQRNPLIIRDSDEAVRRIVGRCIGIGRTATGNWLAFSSTLDYDLGAIMAQDVLKKWRTKGWQDKPAVEKSWGTVVSSENVPADDRKNPAKKCIPVPGGYVLVVELRDEVLDIIGEHANRVRFASRTFATILERNILKRFVGRELLGDDLCVRVVSWQQADRESIQEIVALVERAEDGVIDIEGKKVEVHTESEDVVVDDPEQENAALAGEAEEDAPRDDDPPSDAGVDPVAPTPTADPEVAKRRAKIRELCEKLPVDVAEDAIIAAGLEGMAEVGRCGDVGLLDSATKELNEAVMRKLHAEKASKKSASGN